MNKSFTINVNGKMYIGDLCYALSDEVYSGIWGAHNYEDGAYDAPDGMFAMVGTAYGDGGYESNIGFVFPVDAGIIGICDGRLVAKDITDLGVLVDAKGEANISYNDGTIAITYTTPAGKTEFVDIETAYDDEEDNEDYEDDYSNDYDDEDLDEALNLAKPYTYVDVDYNPVTDMGSVWFEVPVINKENNNRLQIIFDYEKGNNTPKLRLTDGNTNISLEDVPSKFDAKKDQLKDLVKLLEKNANSRIYFIRNLHDVSSDKADNVEVNNTELAYEAKENNKKFKSGNYTDSLINEYLEESLDSQEVLKTIKQNLHLYDDAPFTGFYKLLNGFGIKRNIEIKGNTVVIKFIDTQYESPMGSFTPDYDSPSYDNVYTYKFDFNFQPAAVSSDELARAIVDKLENEDFKTNFDEDSSKYTNY